MDWIVKWGYTTRVFYSDLVDTAIMLTTASVTDAITKARHAQIGPIHHRVTRDEMHDYWVVQVWARALVLPNPNPMPYFKIWGKRKPSANMGE